MEFTNKKNKALREKVKEIIEKAEEVVVNMKSLGEMSNAINSHNAAMQIKQLALDVLVEL